MATFEAQVEALTGITINSSGTNPTEGELTQFLTDGVLDVTEKWLIGHPQDREAFMNETALQVAQGVDIGGADIISVLRADGVTAGNFRPCRKISPSQQSKEVVPSPQSHGSPSPPPFPPLPPLSPPPPLVIVIAGDSMGNPNPWNVKSEVSNDSLSSIVNPHNLLNHLFSFFIKSYVLPFSMSV